MITRKRLVRCVQSVTRHFILTGGEEFRFERRDLNRRHSATRINLARQVRREMNSVKSWVKVKRYTQGV